MRQTRSYPHGYRHGFTHHRTISHPGLHLPQPRVTTLGLNPLTAKGFCTAEFTNRYFRLNHTACLQPILVGYKYHRPTLWRVTIPPPQHDTITIPRAIADDPFLAHSHDDTTTASLKCDEILDHLGSSSAPAYTTKDFYICLQRLQLRGGQLCDKRHI